MKQSNTPSTLRTASNDRQREPTAASGPDRAPVRYKPTTRVDTSRSFLFEPRPDPVARLIGAAHLHEVGDLLRADRPSPLYRATSEALTINETSFFRDREPFDAIRATILPALIEARRPTKRLRLWSAATSTGQEAYSLAILIREHFPELDDWDVKIIATDIAHDVLAYAERARYRRLEINRGLPAKMLLKHFTRSGDEWAINPRVRALCAFTQANLTIPMPSLPVFDLVLMRNVLLYFPDQERKAALRNVHRAMAPDGYLILGSAEQAEDSTDRFQVQFAEKSYFYRPAPQSESR